MDPAEWQSATQYLHYVESLDEAELRQLMDLYGDDIRRYAYALTRDKQKSEDIAQEVFIRVYHRFHTFRGYSSFKTWLFTIARNLAINELRSAYVRRMVLFEWIKPTQAGKSAEEEFMDGEMKRVLQAIILELPAKLREVFVLFHDQGFKVAKIAAILNLTEGTVKSRLHRARQIVSKKWKEWNQG